MFNNIIHKLLKGGRRWKKASTWMMEKTEDDGKEEE
jgi:hypothetical protein